VWRGRGEKVPMQPRRIVEFFFQDMKRGNASFGNDVGGEGEEDGEMEAASVEKQ
jgi:hypothetical protein